MGQADPTNLSTINFTVVFREAVSGFATGDVSLSGTAGATTATVTEVAPNTGTTFNISMSGMTQDGTVIASVPAGAATNIMATGNSASTSTDNIMIYSTPKPTFADVPASHPYYNDIEILHANGLTGGCATNPLNFCPDQIMNRGQAAVFMLRGNFGSSYVPPVPTHIFKDDWSKGTWAEPWAEQAYQDGLIVSCGISDGKPKLCPKDLVSRGLAAQTIVRVKNVSIS